MQCSWEATEVIFQLLSIAFEQAPSSCGQDVPSFMLTTPIDAPQGPVLCDTSSSTATPLKVLMLTWNMATED